MRFNNYSEFVRNFNSLSGFFQLLGSSFLLRHFIAKTLNLDALISPKIGLTSEATLTIKTDHLFWLTFCIMLFLTCSLILSLILDTRFLDQWIGSASYILYIITWYDRMLRAPAAESDHNRELTYSWFFNILDFFLVGFHYGSGFVSLLSAGLVEQCIRITASTAEVTQAHLQKSRMLSFMSIYS